MHHGKIRKLKKKIYTSWNDAICPILCIGKRPMSKKKITNLVYKEIWKKDKQKPFFNLY